jgi:hypothetical protein
MATAIALRLRVNNERASCRLINSFSTSGPKPQDEDNTAESPPPSQTSKHKSVIDGLKSKLHKQPQQQHNRSSSRFSVQNSVSNLEEIASSLSEFRLRTATPPPSGADPIDPLSLEEIYKRNLAGPKSSNPVRKGGILTLDEIQEKERQKKQNATPAATLFSQMSAININPRPSNQPQLSGGDYRSLSKPVFGKEYAEADKVKFVSYSHKELGLMDLRPEEAKGSSKSFSLEELNERLMKLRGIDRIQPASSVPLNIIWESIAKIAEVELGTSSNMEQVEIGRNAHTTPSTQSTQPSSSMSSHQLPPRPPIRSTRGRGRN